MSAKGNGAPSGSAKPSQDETTHDDGEEGSHQAIKMLDHAMGAVAANDNDEEEDEPASSRWANRAPTVVAPASDIGGRPTSKMYV